MAWCSVGSSRSTISIRAALPSGVVSTSARGVPWTGAPAPTTPATPGWERRAVSSRASAEGSAATPGPSRSSSVGPRTPGGKPSSIASAATRAPASAGRPLVRPEPSVVSRSPLAATSSSATVTIAAATATGRAGEQAQRRRGPLGRRRAAPPPHAPTHDRQERGDQRDRDGHADEGGQREAGAERAEEVDASDQEGRRSGRDGDARGGHDRRVAARRRARGGARVVAGLQPARTPKR